ncbi:serine/threonine protein kinase [Streptomyces sp. K1PN6]|uniref:non-specific serine/threonine protein kinase n=1 Tax=Streptomyces acidicola TaxID=2596892 RepID=A0A5N8X382_9ACTN|nr:serine/threonine protein kinase [Streptomyces acidicola]
MGTEGDNFRVIADRYRLEARIGRGGMGVVWRATDQLLGRRVAVKELVLDPSPDDAESRRQRERTLREARAVAQLSHPHIIVVHDVVEHDERPYLVMELIDGGSLAERVAADGPVDAREAARIGIDLLGALRRAHDAGVLHRDLKPANVLMEAGTDRVVLTDFGTAQIAGATTLTETGSFVGSPEYTAPERMAGVRTGPESDLWSLGALLCAVLSGESPFRRDSLGGILHAVVTDEIRPPAQAGPLLPVVRGLLERDPDRRLDATEAERLLRAYLETGRTPPARVGRTPARPDATRASARPDPQDASGATPQDAPAHLRNLAPGEPGAPGGAAERPLRQPTRGVLIAAALVAAMAGAGVSAAALLMRDGGDGGVTPTSSAPSTPGNPSSSPSSPSATDSPSATPSDADSPSDKATPSDTDSPSPSPSPSPSATATATPSAKATPSSSGFTSAGTRSRAATAAAAATGPTAATAPSAPSGHRLAEAPRGFALAVP